MAHQRIVTLFPYTTLFRSRPPALGAAPVAGLVGHDPEQPGPEGSPRPEAPQRSVRLEERLLGRTERSEEHTSELQSHVNLVCRLLLEKKKIILMCSRRVHV